MMIVLFVTLVMTIGLLGDTMDKVLKNSVNVNVLDQVNKGDIKFESVQDLQKYIDVQKRF